MYRSHYLKGQLGCVDDEQARYDVHFYASLKPTDISVLRYWDAHTEAVRHIEVVVNPPTIITSSFDCKVRLWTFHGEMLGALHQAHTAKESIAELSTNPRYVSSRFIPWRFRLAPTVSAAEKAAELATVIMEQLANGEGGPPDKGSSDGGDADDK